MPPLDQHPAHFDGKKRRAMARMAQANRIDPKPWAELTGVKLADPEDPTKWTTMWTTIVGRLTADQILPFWNVVGETLSGGVQSASEQVSGDPFAFFVTGICQRHHEGTSINREGIEEHEGKLWYSQTAVIKTGKRIDQAEAEDMLRYLKAQENVNTCEICGESIECWSSEINRVSAFRARQMVGAPMSPQNSFMNIEDG